MAKKTSAATQQARAAETQAAVPPAAPPGAPAPAVFPPFPWLAWWNPGPTGAAPVPRTERRARAPADAAGILPRAPGGALARFHRAPRARRRAHRRRSICRSGVAAEFAGGVHGARVPAQRRIPGRDGGSRRGRSEDQGAHPLLGVGNGSTPTAPSNFLAFNPQRAASAWSRRAARACRPACRTCCRTSPRGTSRRSTRRRSRSGAMSPRPRARWCSRTTLIQLIQYKPLTPNGARAAVADRAAVHQQVLHPRPAARRIPSFATASSSGNTGLRRFAGAIRTMTWRT